MDDLDLSTAMIKKKLILEKLGYALLSGVYAGFIPWPILDLWQSLSVLVIIGLVLLEIVFVAMTVDHIIQASKVSAGIDDLQAELAYDYPELQGDPNDLSVASYFDKKMMIVVYGHHLVNYRSRQMIDLEQCVFISYDIRQPRRGRGSYSIDGEGIDGLEFRISDDKPLFHRTNKACQELMAFIDENFDIEVEY